MRCASLVAFGYSTSADAEQGFLDEDCRCLCTLIELTGEALHNANAGVCDPSPILPHGDEGHIEHKSGVPRLLLSIATAVMMFNSMVFCFLLFVCLLEHGSTMCVWCCSIHGGAGAIMSIGLMERLPLSFMEDCMADMSGTGESSLCIVPFALHGGLVKALVSHSAAMRPLPCMAALLGADESSWCNRPLLLEVPLNLEMPLHCILVVPAFRLQLLWS